MSLTAEAPPVDFAEEIAAFMEQITTAPANGMISGHGSWHTNKNGRNPYKRLEWSDIVGMVDKPQPGIDKAQAQWLIPSSLDSRVFKEQESGGSFFALWADLDKDPPALDVVAKFADAALKGADYEIYTSRSAREDYPKSRILVPLSEPLSGADWVMAQRAFNALLEEAGIVPDPANERAAQLCYLPNRGEFYDTRSCRDGKRFDPLKVWSDTLQKIRQSDAAAATALKAESEAKRLHREKILAEDVGNTGPSLIDAFNATHSVADILIQAGYEDRGNTFRHPLSESGSFSASVKDGRVHSLSSSDPLYTEGGGVGAHDAFSAFTVLFHDGDQNKALKDAGDKWVMVGDESWNTVRRRKFAEEAASSDPTRYKPLRYSDLLSLSPAEEIVEDLLPAEGSFCIFGQSGVGKTFLTLDLMLAIAKGETEWFGRCVRQTPVIYMALEGKQGIRDRLDAYLLEHGGEIPDSFRVIYSAFDIASAVDRLDMIKAIESEGLENPVVVIDTMTRATPGLDLNGPKDMGTVIQGLDAVQRGIGGLVGTVYHSTIKTAGTSEDATEMGHSSFRGSLDASILVLEKDGMKCWRSRKVKDGPESDAQAFELSVHEVRKNQWGRPKTSCAVVSLTKDEAENVRERRERDHNHAVMQKVINHLWTEDQINGWKKDWFGVSRNECLKVIAGKKQAAIDTLAEMVDLRAIRLIKDGSASNSPKFYRINADWEAPEAFQPFPPPPGDLRLSEEDNHDI